MPIETDGPIPALLSSRYIAILKEKLVSNLARCFEHKRTLKRKAALRKF
jgi:hypothetical protein